MWSEEGGSHCVLLVRTRYVDDWEDMSFMLGIL